MKNFLLVTTILSLSLNPLGFAYITVAHAETVLETEDKTIDVEAEKKNIYSTLEELYVTSSCKPFTAAQKKKIEAINKFSETAKFSSAEALLSNYQQKMEDFFTKDFVPHNCEDKTKDQQQSSGGGGGGGGMCQLMQMLQMLIPAAAAALASGGTLGDAQAIGQQEMAALQQNQRKTDQTQDQKQERARQMAAVGQGLAMIAKAMGGGMGGQQQGQQSGSQQGGGCGGGGSK